MDRTWGLAAVIVAFALAGCATPPVAQGPGPAVSAAMSAAPEAARPTPDQERALLAPYRARINDVDAKIGALLGERFAIVRQVAALKAENGIPPILPDRIEEVVRHARANAEKQGYDPDAAEKIYRVLIDAACALEASYAADLRNGNRPAGAE